MWLKSVLVTYIKYGTLSINDVTQSGAGALQDTFVRQQPFLNDRHLQISDKIHNWPFSQICLHLDLKSHNLE